jgi:hypothetical protein
VNREPKLWVRRRWLAYLRKVRNQSEEGGKSNGTRKEPKES